MSSGKPTKEGELKKYKNPFQGWGSRYFKLERSYFHYFETKDAPRPIDTMNRGDITQVILSKQFLNKCNVFEVHAKTGVVWYLQANSESEMMNWMGSLKPDMYPPPSSESPQLAHSHHHQAPQRLYPSLAAHGLHVSPSGSQTNTPHIHSNSPYNPHVSPGYHTPPSTQYGTHIPPGETHPTTSPYNTPPGVHHYNPSPSGAHCTPPVGQYYTPPGAPYSTPSPGTSYGATPPGIPYSTPLAGPSNNTTEYSPPPPYQEVPDAPPLPSKNGLS